MQVRVYAEGVCIREAHLTNRRTLNVGRDVTHNLQLPVARGPALLFRLHYISATEARLEDHTEGQLQVNDAPAVDQSVVTPAHWLHLEHLAIRLSETPARAQTATMMSFEDAAPAIQIDSANGDVRRLDPRTLTADQPLVIGRKPPADVASITLADGRLASRVHLHLWAEGPRWKLEVLSKNGARLNKVDLPMGAVVSFRPGVLQPAHLQCGTQSFRLTQVPRRIDFVPRSAAMCRIYELIERDYADSELPFLILGETGVGKSFLAAHVHQCSHRATHPFITCASPHDSLNGTDLFGCTDGAFSGVSARLGAFREAAHGTLFLDEIGDYSTTTQHQLLRAIDTGQIQVLGENGERHVDARVIGATLVDIPHAITAGAFREDLYRRLLKLPPLLVPPLRDRIEDIPPLVDVFLAQQELPAESVADDAMSVLTEHKWPHNLGELQSVLQEMHRNASARRASQMRAEDARIAIEESRRLRERRDVGETTVVTETKKARHHPVRPTKEVIVTALEAAGGNIRRTADDLSLHEATLRRYMRSHGLDARDFRNT
ncbi:MAG: sigma 54-interacting transcriptional regulator [Deltaproteobacteria bacterium]|jgi:DNA-binding NtrC family response regulator